MNPKPLFVDYLTSGVIEVWRPDVHNPHTYHAFYNPTQASLRRLERLIAFNPRLDMRLVSLNKRLMTIAVYRKN